MTSFHIETYGCSANVADSEQMAGLLQQARFLHTNSLEEADIIILNSCTVKSPSVNAFINRVAELKKQHPYKSFVIAGCIPQSQPELFEEFSVIGTKQIHRIVEVVEETINNNIIKCLETGEMPPLNLPKLRKNPIVEIIPISRGCLSACTFCMTKSARGSLKSYPVPEIVEAAQQGIRQGVREIWLTSQDTMCYGFDLQTNLASLLLELIRLPGHFKIRVGMGNPVHLKKFSGQLLPLFNHPKVFKFLHLPAQSGSDKVLKDMRRGNTNEEFLQLVKKAREAVPNITLATDIICGYPTETEEDHWETLNMLRETTPDVVNISRFWPRPGTKAAELPELPVEVVKHRTKVITDLFTNISKMQNERWIGWEGEIIIDENGRDAGQWAGRNESYKPVIVAGGYKIGDKVKVRIAKAGTFELWGVPQEV